MTVAEAVDSGTASPLVWESFYWGLISALSLNIGSIIGVSCLPSKKVRAILMAFGGGALLFALSIELFGRVLNKAAADDTTAPVWVMEGTAVIGGCFFAFLNYALNKFGADFRKESTSKSRFARLRRMLMQRLAARLTKIPFFSVLDLDEIKDLIQCAMFKQRFSAGEVIFSEDDADGIFFILSGEVHLQIFGDEKDEPLSPFPAVDLAQWCGPRADIGVGMKEAFTDMNGRPKSTGEILGSRKSALASLMQPRTVTVEPATPKEEKGGLRRRKSNPAILDEGLTPSDRRVEVPLYEWCLGHNQIFGDMTVLTGSYQRVTARALTPVKVLVLPEHEVARLVEQNPAVRKQVSKQCMKRVEELQHIPDHLLDSLAENCSLVRHQKGDTVFRGIVGAKTPIICIVLGGIECRSKTSKRTVHAGRLICTDHLQSGMPSALYVAKALEPTIVVHIQRSEVDEVMARGANITVQDIEEESAIPGQVPVPDKTRDPGRKDTRHKSHDVAAEGGDGGATSFEDPEEAWAHLGWDDGSDNDSEVEKVRLRQDSATLGQVTDLELADLQLTQNHRRTGSKRSAEPPKSEDPISEAPDTRVICGDNILNGTANVNHGAHGHGHSESGRHRAVMVWLGILIDAIPESLVIGIIINKSFVEGQDVARNAAAAVLPFVIGVFISNLPEAMSSSGIMKAHGMSVKVILLMWVTTTVLTAAGSVIGAVLFPPSVNSHEIDNGSALAIVGVEGLAAGAMLTMIAQTMMPEAFEQGGDVVGLSCLAGFLVALSVKLFPLKATH
mmetsp:Transcript_48442/g.139302  ORF Transcript_48442/g.139302 Transcript_48442/m.139302 type:complete len:786 (-) Transcript_48442:197-2554(-)